MPWWAMIPSIGSFIWQFPTLATAMDRSHNWIIEDALRHSVEAQAWQVETLQILRVYYSAREWSESFA